MPSGASSLRFRLIFAGAVGLILASVFVIGLTVWRLHNDAIADASKDTNNLAVVLAHQIDNSTYSIDIILNDIRKEGRNARLSNDLERFVGSESTYKLLRERLSHLRQAEFIGLMDKNGRLVNTTRQWPPPKINLSDRAYFQHFKNSHDDGVYISRALFDRIKRLNVIIFSKPIIGADNAFLGVAVVGVRTTYFKTIYRVHCNSSQSVFCTAPSRRRRPHTVP